MENSYVDFNKANSAVIQWLYESEPARWAYQRLIWRATLAKVGKPCRNVYRDELRSNLERAEAAIRGAYLDRCEHVPEGSSFALKKAVDNIASQMASGVDSYDYRINDPYMIIEPDTEDLLSAKCSQDYVENKLQLLAPVFSNDLMWFGMAAALVKYDPVKDKNHVVRVHPKNVWFDTKFSSTGEERFRGYSTMVSWKKLKAMVENDGDQINLDIKAPDGSPLKEEENGGNKRLVVDKSAKFSNRKIRSLNGLDIYVDTMNKLAASPSLAAGLVHPLEYDHDLRQCYNLGWYQSLATDPEKRTNSNYNGDDVELTVIYDLSEKIEYKIINRRFVVSMNQKAFRRKIRFTWVDPREEGATGSRIEDFCLDCPLKFAYPTVDNMDLAPHPWAPAFSLLDTHDQLCGWRAKREHVAKILSILRIDTNGSDADSLSRKINIMGAMFDDLQGDVGTIQFPYDYSHIDSEIAHLESRIQQILHAYDMFDALQAMGDRASSQEAGVATSAVAQGLSVHQNALMGLFADVARQCITNRVAYSARQEFPVVNHGKYRSITLQQMALSAVIDVKSKLAGQIERRQGAANALAMLGSMGKGISISDSGAAFLMQKALYDLVPRKMAETFVKEAGPSPEELALAKQSAQNDAEILRQNQVAYGQNPLPYEVSEAMKQYSPDEIDTAIKELGGEAPALRENGEVDVLDMEQQDGSLSLDMEGMTPELGSMLANSNGI